MDPPADAPRETCEPAAAHELFRRLAHTTAYLIGTPVAFMIAVLAIVLWAVTGPLFHFSDTWQLIINTGTTVVTFLVVFMIQNTQNRDSKAMHLKLDELIRAVKTARNAMVNIEDLPDAEIARLQREMRAVCSKREGRRDGRDPHRSTHS
ncbi:MAG TPA: low affinity iron permease family protein [Kofleriaceae bacterium]|nr:low affinity iron permease family protein [Kofleriaceae bacterium]